MAKYNRGINTKQNKAPKDRIVNYEWNDLWNEVTEFGEYVETGLQSLLGTQEDYAERFITNEENIDNLDTRVGRLEYIEPTTVFTQSDKPNEENTNNNDIWFKIID